MTSAEDFKKFFVMADTDKSGTLTLNELLPALKKAGFKGTDKQIKGMFNQAETSGDGLVTLDEFLIVMGALPEPNRKEARMRSLFRDYDQDDNGYITAGEMKAIMAEQGSNLSDKEATRMIQLMEGDTGDGKVNYEEFLKYYQQ